MNLYTKYFTENPCMKYTGNRKETKGIIVHSTACGFVPAKDWYDRWNKPTVEKAVHAFVDDTSVCQYLPWEHECWGAGKKEGNQQYINFECCEPANVYKDTYIPAKNQAYFDKMYENAKELLVMLCKMYNLTEKDIVCHCEGYKLGIASNHGDVKVFFGKHGKTMDGLRAEVKKLLEKEPVKTKYEVGDIVKFVGKYLYNAPDATTASSEVNKKTECEIVQTAPDEKHQYMIRFSISGSADIRGWVDEDELADLPIEQVIQVGDIVNFKGGYHYSNANKETATGGVRKSGEAKVLAISANALHPYCLKYTTGSKSNVYGWVDKNTVEMAETIETFAVGDVVKIKEGCSTYSNGKSMPLWVRLAKLYVRQINDDGTTIVSILKSGAITGTVQNTDIIHYI